MAKRSGKVGGRIDVTELASTVMNQLTDYDTYVSGTVMAAAIEETAKETAEIVESEAPVRTGVYQNAITYGNLTRGHDKKHQSHMTVYAESPEYRLTHLLEKPHALVGGGRSEPTEHWGKGEKDLSDRFVNNFKKRL